MRNSIRCALVLVIGLAAIFVPITAVMAIYSGIARTDDAVAQWALAVVVTWIVAHELAQWL